ncbi:hypothetical protein OPV22_011947 [Ensete ventricosum]|uniref:Uncharacterized protein n=1 Tax=Ensete ventricosum TaxID=4639 RepID=A0AAV8Q6P9_ENSVE|nr:hypothetical protein OPV22_011947 [Ensete ventricosum]
MLQVRIRLSKGSASPATRRRRRRRSPCNLRERVRFCVRCWFPYSLYGRANRNRPAHCRGTQKKELAPHITPSLSTLGCSKLLNPPSLWNMQPETKSHKKHLYTPQLVRSACLLRVKTLKDNSIAAGNGMVRGILPHLPFHNFGIITTHPSAATRRFRGPQLSRS